MYESGSGGEFGGLFFLFVFALYVYFAFAQFRIAKKLRHNSPWYAFVPILNTIQLIQMAGKPLYWFVFLLLPIVNIICFAVLWMDVAKYAGHSPILGFFVIIPPVSLVTIGIMAFSEGKSQAGPFPPHDHTKPRQPQSVG